MITPYDLLKQFNEFMKSQQSTNAFAKKHSWISKPNSENRLPKIIKLQFPNLETKFTELADKQSGRPSGSLPSNTQPNPKGHNSKAYQPPPPKKQSRNDHVNVVFTRSDFVILEMKEYNKVSPHLWDDPFFQPADAINSSLKNRNNSTLELELTNDFNIDSARNTPIQMMIPVLISMSSI
ncbi:hypothetical protein Tco_0369357 [Tanacetum coccineum]